MLKLTIIKVIGLALVGAIVAACTIPPERGLKPGTVASPGSSRPWYQEALTLPEVNSEDYLAHHRYHPNTLKAQSLFGYEDILSGRVGVSKAARTALIDVFVDQDSQCFVQPTYVPAGFFVAAAAIAGECDGFLFYVSVDHQTAGQDQSTFRVASYEDVRALVEVASYKQIRLPIPALLIQGNLVPDVYTPFPWSKTKQPGSVARWDRQSSKSVIFQKDGRTIVVTGYQPRLWFGEFAPPYWTDKEMVMIATSIRTCCTSPLGAGKS